MSWLDKDIEKARARKRKEDAELARAEEFQLEMAAEMDILNHLDWLRELQTSRHTD